MKTTSNIFRKVTIGLCAGALLVGVALAIMLVHLWKSEGLQEAEAAQVAQDAEFTPQAIDISSYTEITSCGILAAGGKYKVTSTKSISASSGSGCLVIPNSSSDSSFVTIYISAGVTCTVRGGSASTSGQGSAVDTYPKLVIRSERQLKATGGNGFSARDGSDGNEGEITNFASSEMFGGVPGPGGNGSNGEGAGIGANGKTGGKAQGIDGLGCITVMAGSNSRCNGYDSGALSPRLGENYSNYVLGSIAILDTVKVVAQKGDSPTPATAIPKSGLHDNSYGSGWGNTYYAGGGGAGGNGCIGYPGYDLGLGGPGGHAGGRGGGGGTTAAGSDWFSYDSIWSQGTSEIGKNMYARGGAGQGCGQTSIRVWTGGSAKANNAAKYTTYTFNAQNDYSNIKFGSCWLKSNEQCDTNEGIGCTCRHRRQCTWQLHPTHIL